MKGLLVRVGIDQTAGGMNGPVNLNTGQFAYIPIPESQEHVMRPHQERYYDEFQRTLEGFSQSLPKHLQDNKRVHLDPDFEHLTYGDQGQRAKQIREKLKPGDFIAFYSALKPLQQVKELCYALTGLMFIEKMMPAKSVPQSDWHRFAHARFTPDDTDLVIVADKARSGRFERALPIGEFRDKAYRVTPGVLNGWGGLSVNDGYLQRSARLPEFLNPKKFLGWLEKQKISLIQQNNIPST